MLQIAISSCQPAWRREVWSEAVPQRSLFQVHLAHVCGRDTRKERPPTTPNTTLNSAARTTLAAQRETRRHCLVVVPTYNEALNIERLVAEVLGQGPQFDVLVVHDGSPDGTGDLVAGMAALTPRVQLLRLPGKLGLGTAYLAGFREGLRQGYRFLCEMDATSRTSRATCRCCWQWPMRGRRGDWLAQCAGRPRRELVAGAQADQPRRQPVRAHAAGYARARLHRRLQVLSRQRATAARPWLDWIERLRLSGAELDVAATRPASTKSLSIIFPDCVAGQSKMSQQIVWRRRPWRLRCVSRPTHTSTCAWRARSKLQQRPSTESTVLPKAQAASSESLSKPRAEQARTATALSGERWRHHFNEYRSDWPGPCVGGWRQRGKRDQ